MHSNLHHKDFLLPIGLMNVISILPLLLLAPFIECVTTCYLSAEKVPLAPVKVISRHLVNPFISTLTNNNSLSKSRSGISLFCLRPIYDQYSPPPPIPLLSLAAALGHGCAALSVLVAGLSELHRKAYPLVEQTLSGKVLLVSSMPCFQLAPQYILLGLAEALVTPACE